MKSRMSNEILFCVKRKAAKTKRLISFPYAGGGMSTFLPWCELLGPEIELWIVQLPGRGYRFLEQSFREMKPLVKTIVAELKDDNSVDTIFFGHSMGALVAFETICELSKNGRSLPAQFIASGCSAPTCERERKGSYSLSDSEFKKLLSSLNGTPKALLENEEIMDLCLPAIRADFEIIETYSPSFLQEAEVDLHIFAGKNDMISPESIEGWRGHFELNENEIVWFECGHFFVDTKNKECVGALKRIIAK